MGGSAPGAPAVSRRRYPYEQASWSHSAGPKRVRRSFACSPSTPDRATGRSSTFSLPRVLLIPLEGEGCSLCGDPNLPGVPKQNSLTPAPLEVAGTGRRTDVRRVFMRLRTMLLGVPLLAVTGACVRGSEAMSDPLNLSKLPQLQIAQTTRIGDEVRGPEYVLAQVAAGGFVSDTSFIVGSGLDKQVRVYSTRGLLLRTLGRPGAGPGEFRTITALACLDDGRFAIWDAQLARVTIFGEDGRIRAIHTLDLASFNALRPAFVGVASGGDLVMMDSPSIASMGRYPAGLRRDTLRFMVFAPRENEWRSVASLEGPEYWFYRDQNAWGALELLFSRKVVSAVVGDDLVVGTTDALDFRMISLGNGAMHMLRLERPTRVASTQEKEAERQLRLKALDEPFPVRGQAVERGLDAQRTALQVLSEHSTIPAFRDLVADRSGGFWLREFESTAATGRLWYRLSPSLAPVGWIELRRGERVLDATDHRLLLLHTDEWGVETVAAATWQEEG